MSTTDVLAWWGAIIGSLVFVWDIYKWMKERVQISVMAAEYDVPAEKGIRCEIRNRGGRPTTIKEVMLVNYQKRQFRTYFLRIFDAERSVRKSQDGSLPFLLQPGAMWTGYYNYEEETHTMLCEDIAALVEQGTLYFKVKTSDSDRAIRGLVRQETMEL